MKIAWIALTIAITAVGQSPQAHLCTSETPCPPLTITRGIADLYMKKDDKGSLSIDTQASGRIVKLSDEEYARLQKLRQAVVDAETEIAKGHGVDPVGVAGDSGQCLIADGRCLTWAREPVAYKAPDRYQFAGQFLLINLPKAAK